MTLKFKFLTIFCALLFIIAFMGCTGKNNSNEEPLKESISFSAADTSQVMNLMNQYFDLLMKRDYEGAMSMVSQLKNDSLTELSPEVEKHYLMGMKIISPIRFELESMVFETETDCLVKYSAVLFDKEDKDDNRPNKMFYGIKPVRVNDKWYLTVSDSEDLNTRDSNIAN